MHESSLDARLRSITDNVLGRISGHMRLKVDDCRQRCTTHEHEDRMAIATNGYQWLCLECVGGYLASEGMGDCSPLVALVPDTNFLSMVDQYYRAVSDQASSSTWFSPSRVPDVPEGYELLCWIAVRLSSGDVSVESAFYQNRPLITDEEGGVLNPDSCLCSPDGESVHQVGWVEVGLHADYGKFFKPIEFGEGFEFLGWTVQRVPAFSGVLAVD